MRRIVVALMGTVSGLALLFSFQSSLEQSALAGDEVTDTGTGEATGPQAEPAASPASADPAAASFTGQLIESERGPVQVQISVLDGKIVTAEAVVYPNESKKDRKLNAKALPILNAATVKAQNANLDAVSGATVTSEAYMQSLQSAIDASHA